MAEKLIEGLLKYWPFANAEKERAFLEAMSEAIKAILKNSKTERKIRDDLLKATCRRFLKCLGSPHQGTVIFAMNLLGIEDLQVILKHEDFRSHIGPVLEFVKTNHWSDDIKLKRLPKFEDHVKKCISIKIDKLDPYLFQDSKEYENERKNADNTWDQLYKKVKEKNPDFKMPVIPYSKDHIVGENNGLNNGNAFRV